MSMNFSIEELYDLIKKAHNTAIEEAAKILDAKSAALSVEAGNCLSRFDAAELQAGALLCLTAAVEVRELKRE